MRLLYLLRLQCAASMTKGKKPLLDFQDISSTAKRAKRDVLARESSWPKLCTATESSFGKESLLSQESSLFIVAKSSIATEYSCASLIATKST